MPKLEQSNCVGVDGIQWRDEVAMLVLWTTRLEWPTTSNLHWKERESAPSKL